MGASTFALPAIRGQLYFDDLAARELRACLNAAIARVATVLPRRHVDLRPTLMEKCLASYRLSLSGVKIFTFVALLTDGTDLTLVSGNISQYAFLSPHAR
jgi:hypothetical protein